MNFTYMARFLGKTPRNKLVRPIPNSRKMHTATSVVSDEKVTKVVKKEDDNKAETIKENKEKVDMEDRLEKIENIMNSKAPKRKVKVEKKDKGLIERTEESTILLTEDNKMVLMD